MEAAELLAAHGAAAAAADRLLREVHAGRELSAAAAARLHGYLLACGTEQSIVQVNLMCEPATGRVRRPCNRTVQVEIRIGWVRMHDFGHA